MRTDNIIIATTSPPFARTIRDTINYRNSVKILFSQHDDELRGKIKENKAGLVLIEECFCKRITPYVMGTLHYKYPRTKFAVFSYTEMEPVELAYFLTSGASSFINFRLEPEEWARGLSLVVSGGDYLPQNIRGKVPASPLRKTSLTRRKMAVMFLLAAGCKPDNISKLLGIEKGTLRTHKNNIYTKCGIHNMADLVNFVHDMNDQKGVRQTVQDRTE